VKQKVQNEPVKQYPSLINIMSNNELIELISLSVKLSKHHCSKILLLSGIQLDRKESLDQPYLEQHTKVLLPNRVILGKNHTVPGN